MTSKIGLIAGLIATGLLLAAVACGSNGGTDTPAGGAQPTPDVQATLEALAQRVELGTPTPTAVPAEARIAALNFASGQRNVSQNWDQFHGEFDSWREGLVACTASSVRSSLQGFAGRFAGVAQAARALPRPGVVRGLADTLIRAAELQEEALRLLRDTWQPGGVAVLLVTAGDDGVDNSDDPNSSTPLAAVSQFEGVDIARSASSVLRQEVADALSDRQERTAPGSLERISEFVATFNSTDAAWDQFHQEYDSFRRSEGQLTSGELVDRLGLLIDQFREIVVAIRQVPTTDTTRDVADALAQAAEDEDLALRRLRGTFQRDGVPANGVPGEAVAPSGEVGESEEPVATTPTGNSGGEGVGTFTATDPGLYDAFDAQLVSSNAARLVARRNLEDILDDISEETGVVVEDFTEQYRLLLQEWNDFHKDYDEWRRSEGGCDRSNAVDTLGRSTVTFGNIATEVRSLPAATVLRPLGEILVEAAEREERALRVLRDTWQPYDAEVYRALDRERDTAGKLRRQVAVGIQELLERFGISLEELN